MPSLPPEKKLSADQQLEKNVIWHPYVFATIVLFGLVLFTFILFVSNGLIADRGIPNTQPAQVPSEKN